jgi:hypothetical protein
MKRSEYGKYNFGTKNFTPKTTNNQIIHDSVPGIVRMESGTELGITQLFVSEQVFVHPSPTFVNS